ncbi:IclR family transcriptional regulator [Agrococcus sp. ARC_14]|uniref:IclR family transcriptional regulator n=1 Tax=Agrococcus sp. ARC_14 TaxID=2919927 RepID=UPI001F0543CC|nr:IclR family transcriptional regulator [Agrococcus sp. ARC_14]MCH1882001.1 IclR family transcriptional regulator [Agrococcus sp. ARC_14]
MVRSLENTKPESADDGRIVQSVARAIRLLKYMATVGKPLSLSLLARSVEMSKPAAFHLLRTLQLQGIVHKNEDATYELSWGLWELGASVTRNLDVVQAARHHLDQLAEATGEVVLLSIRDGSSVIYLDRTEAGAGFGAVMVANSGRRSSLHANASGKLLLAFAPQSVIDDVMSQPLRQFSSATITDPLVLNNQLGEIRRDNFSSCWQEQELGVSSIAVPIRDYSGGVVAAVAVAGPAARVNRQVLARLSAPLLAAGAHISRDLGAIIR